MLQKFGTGKHLYLFLALICSLYLQDAHSKTLSSYPASSYARKWVPNSPLKRGWASSSGARFFQTGVNKAASRLTDVTLTYQNFQYPNYYYHFIFTDANFFNWYFSTTLNSATGVLGTLPAGIYTVQISSTCPNYIWYRIACCYDTPYGAGDIILYNVEVSETDCNQVVLSTV